MDHDAIICFMIDRLTRGPDKDVHVPGVGSTKVPFSRCRCHILVIDYRWGSMGSNETATATTGGPRVIDVFDGNGAPSGPNYLLLWMQIGSRTPSGIGLRSGSRLDRMRRFLGPSIASEAIANPLLGGSVAVLWAALMRELAEICWKRRRMRCRRLHG